jgi:hypothetical protein
MDPDATGQPFRHWVVNPTTSQQKGRPILYKFHCAIISTASRKRGACV